MFLPLQAGRHPRPQRRRGQEGEERHSRHQQGRRACPCLETEGIKSVTFLIIDLCNTYNLEFG